MEGILISELKNTSTLTITLRYHQNFKFENFDFLRRKITQAQYFLEYRDDTSSGDIVSFHFTAYSFKCNLTLLPSPFY